MKKYSLLLLLIFFPLSGFAFNSDFFNDTAISYFTKTDWQLFNHATETALNNRKDGTKVTWRNPQTGHYGYVIPVHTARYNGWHCRDIIVFTDANYRKGESRFHLCKVNNEWKVM